MASRNACPAPHIRLYTLSRNARWSLGAAVGNAWAPPAAAGRTHPLEAFTALGRGAVVAAVASFALVVGTPAPASAALDPKPAEAAAGWLAGELTGGRSLNEDSEFYDYGLTADTWFALDAAGTEAKKRRAIVRALKDHVEDYISSVR
ncbi:MAG: hypothetical protein WKF83_15410 [Nocardioidaceae bacterium]